MDAILHRIYQDLMLDYEDLARHRPLTEAERAAYREAKSAYEELEAAEKEGSH
jgi:hypothetical protein